MPKAVDQPTPLAILPIYVERNPRYGNLFFRLSQGSRKRPLPRDPTTAEFDRAYHAALVDAGENNDLDDWTELEILYARQRREERRKAKLSRPPMGSELEARLAKFRCMAIRGLALLLVQDRRACGAASGNPCGERQ